MNNFRWDVNMNYLRLFILSLFFSIGSLAQDQEAGKIVLVKGEVFIMNSKSQVVADPEGKRGRSTKVSQPFFVGERVVTKASGRVKLRFIEGGNEVVLGADTSLLIERAGTSASNKGTSLNLAKGEVRASVNPDLKYSGSGKDVFEVKTPNAVAGVRGTVFMTRFSTKTMRSEVATEKGAVFVGSPGRPAAEGVIVKKGLFTSLGGTGGVRPAPPKPIAENPSLMNSMQSLSGAKGESDKKDASDSTGANGSNGESQKSADSQNGEGSNGGVADSSTGSGAASEASSSGSGETASNSGESGSALEAPLSREPVSADTAARSPASATGSTSITPGTPTLMGEGPLGGGDSASGTPVLAPIVTPRLPTTTIPRTVQDAITSRSNDTVFQNTKATVKIPIPKP